MIVVVEPGQFVLGSGENYNSLRGDSSYFGDIQSNKPFSDISTAN
jgi:hypothetical protein